jgi:hypothetical protein
MASQDETEGPAAGGRPEQYDKAESWLAGIARHVEMTPDQEALVYLRSRGQECHDEVSALVEAWKEDEKGRLAEWHSRYPEANHAIIAQASSFLLRNFWDAAGVGDHTFDATMLRSVEWCEVRGFEPWWRRLAADYKEKWLQGGMAESVEAAHWLFSMARSDYAIQLMPEVLLGALNYIGLPSRDHGESWILPDPSEIAEQVDRASAILFAHHRLPSSRCDPQLIHQAEETIAKHQDGSGGWPVPSGDTKPSVESTAMALHALGVSQPQGWKRVSARARDWLLSAQLPDGSWAEGGVSPVYLTVLVLDAIELVRGGEHLTFRWRSAQPAEEVQLVETETAPGVTGGTEALELNTADQRRKAVDDYINLVLDRTKQRITRTDIWKAAGHREATQFERWQRADPHTTKSAERSFSRILREKPHLQ